MKDSIDTFKLHFKALRDSFEWQYVILFGMPLVAYLAIYLYSGFRPGSINHFNSFSVQAASWLDGRLDVDFVSHLEIAIFEGRYFISFPPFPSVIMLPFVAIFGPHTPDNVLAVVVSLLCALVAYELAKMHLKDRNQSLFLSLFLVLGTNYFHVAFLGSVWHFAQNLAFLFTLCAFYFATTDKRGHTWASLLFYCMAMGTRPLNVVGLPVLLILLYKRELVSGGGFKTFVIHMFKHCWPAVLLGVGFMTLNYARFGNPLQIGHDFLPEHVHSVHGQFSRHYFRNNIIRLFTRMPDFYDEILSFPRFGGHAFWLASPIILTYLFYFIVNLFRIRRTKILDTIINFAIFLTILLHVFIFAFHVTLGGHQFGSRYTVDMLPLMFVGLLFTLKPRGRVLLYCHSLLFFAGFIMNFMGNLRYLGVGIH